MIGFFPRSRARRTKHLIAIDIGSATAIRSLLFRQEPGARFILGKRHTGLPTRERGEDLIPFIAGHLRQMITRYLRQIGRAPDEILIGIGGRFTFNEMAVARRERERPDAPVRTAEFQDIIRDFLRAHRERPGQGSGYHLAHIVPFQTLVDGYPIDQLSGRTCGRTLEVTLLTTYAQHSYWEALSSLRSMWGGLAIRFTSDQAAIAAALSSLFGVGDALIVKIGASITEVSLFADGAIRSTGRFDAGGESCTLAIAERLKIPSADAERIKRQWGRTILPPEVQRAAAAAIAAGAEQWLAAFSAFLERDERLLVPARVYILGGGARLGELARALASRPWHSTSPPYDEVRVSRLEGQEIAEAFFRNSNPLLTGPEEAALAAIAVRLGQEYD